VKVLIHTPAFGFAVNAVHASSDPIFEYLQLFETRFATSLSTLHSTVSVGARVIALNVPVAFTEALFPFT
jgi:hypothetical protein